MNIYSRITITRYQNYFNSKNLDPYEFSGSFDHLCDQFFTPIRDFPDLDHKSAIDRDTAKKSMDAYVCGPIDENSTKSDDSLQYVSFLALDNDNKISNKDLSKELKKMNINSLIYPTASNGVIDPTTRKLKNGCRVLIEIDYSITPERFREIKPHLEVLFPWADIAAMKASQYFIGHFTMSNMTKRFSTAYRIHGESLKVRDMPKIDERPRDAKRRKLSDSGVVLHTSGVVEFDDNKVFYGRDGLAYTFDEIVTNNMCASKWHCPWCEGSSGTPNAHFHIADDGQHMFFCNHSNKGCGVRGLYRQSSAKLISNIESFNKRQMNAASRRAKTVKSTIKTDLPFDYSDISEMIINEIDGITSEITILAGFEGIGKSRYVNHLVSTGEKLYFGSFSNAQALEQYNSFISQGINAGLYRSKSNILTEMGVDVEYIDSKKSFSGGKINRKKTLASIMEVLNMTEAEAKSFYEDIKSIEVSDFGKYDVICMTHTMLESFSSRKNDYKKVLQGFEQQDYTTLNDDWIVYYDDPSVENLFWLSPSKKKDLDVFEQVTFEVNNYSVRPQNQRPLINLQNRIVFSTTETLCVELIKRLYSDKDICIPDLYFHDRLRAGDSHLIVSNKVRKANHNIFPFLQEYFERETGESWKLIADGVGAEYNYSTINGANSLKDSNVIMKLSFPHIDMTNLVRAHLPELSIAEANMLIMVDRMNQAVGRNQGYRFNGKTLIVYIEPLHSDAVIDLCRYSFNTMNVETQFQSTKFDSGVVKMIATATDMNFDVKMVNDLLTDARTAIAKPKPKKKDLETYATLYALALEMSA